MGGWKSRWRSATAQLGSPSRGVSEASSATAWTAAITEDTAASAPGKRGSGQSSKRERTLKEDVSQPALPPPLGGKGDYWPSASWNLPPGEHGTCFNTTVTS